MTESRASSSDPAATRERDDVLATKVTIPRTRPDRLARAELLQRLNEGMGRPLTLISTPAGFGKTTLLADWAASANRAVAWLSLDPDDNDPVRFWRYVALALNRACEGLGEQLLLLLAAPRSPSGRGMVTALVGRLETQPEDLTLVLDDYHLIEETAIHDSLAFLLSHLPPQLHLAISSRSDPPLPVARLRVGNQLTELRASDLRFTPEESAAFLQNVWKLDLPPEAVAALEARTEGWAAGLQLAALSLQRRPDSSGFVEAFTGTHRYVLDYLTEEVLERLPDRVRTFLLDTSILERLGGPLCDAVTGGANGQAMLEELERANLFLVPLDEERRWWRFHHLFADLLRARLGQLRPDLQAELHRRAAGWCEEHRLIDQAIQHALSARDTTWAKRLVERQVGETLRRGESRTLQRWLSLLPNEAVRSRPALCLAESLMQLHLGHLRSAEGLLEHAEHAVEAQGDREVLEVPTDGGMVAEIPAAIALLRAEVAADRGDPERTADLARLALAQLAEQERGPQLWGRWLLVLADLMSGQMEKAELGFVQILADARTTIDPHPLTTSCHALGWVQQDRGRLGAALRTYRDGLCFATEGGRFLPFHAGEAHVGIAQVLYARNELDEALRHVTEGIDLTRQVVEFRLPAFGLVALAWIRQAMGDADRADEAIDEACHLLPASDVVTMFSPAQTERAALFLAQGRIAEAARWVRQRGLAAEDDISYPRERDYLVLARVLLYQSQPVQALRLLERLDILATAHGRVRSMIEIRALRSLALQAAGEHDDALNMLAGALALARPEGFVRLFADAGPSMAALLRSLIGARERGRSAARDGPATQHLHLVVRSFGPGGHQAGPTTPAAPGLIEPLTDRELEVLRLLAMGRRNRDIAQELVITLETVKKHVSHIFEKLGAANRTQAVAHARRLDLIP